MREEVEVRVGEAVLAFAAQVLAHGLPLGPDVLLDRTLDGLHIGVLVEGDQHHQLHAGLGLDELLDLGLGVRVEVAVAFELLLELFELLGLFGSGDAADVALLPHFGLLLGLRFLYLLLPELL